MVLEALFGSAAIGASGIWGYNRENFLYDREMRQEQEFQIIDMRLAQVNLWRDDVREMIGLTEKKDGCLHDCQRIAAWLHSHAFH